MGISFGRPFYFDAAALVANDVIMRRVLHERFGDIGVGEANPQPRPVAGVLDVAGGFVIPRCSAWRSVFRPTKRPSRCRFT